MPKPPESSVQNHPRAPHPLHLSACLRKASLVSGIFCFKTMRERLSNAVAELGARCPCKSLKWRPCCHETLDRNAVDTLCDQTRKSIRNRGKDSQGCDFCSTVQMRSPDGEECNPRLPRCVDAAPNFAPLHPATLATLALKLTPASVCQHKVDKSVNAWLTVILSLTKRAEPCQRLKIPSAYTAARFAGKHKLRSRHSSPAPACSFATNACTFVGKSPSKSGSQHRKRCRRSYPTTRPPRHC